ncbi:hypothetical protein IJG79_02110 [Candidatus Saccharibacteria bacterium]|nr:hypothetical protein [Candidatus Saccharibacteria bacterium]
MAKKKKAGDDFYFEKLDRILRGIYDEQRTDIEGILEEIKNSSKCFESEFTEMEQFMFMETFGSLYETCMNNKLFFLFKTTKGVSAAYAITPLPLRPRKDKTVLLTHIGFNNKWYCVDDFLKIFMEEIQYTVTNMKLVTGVSLRNHIYSYVAVNP